MNEKIFDLCKSLLEGICGFLTPVMLLGCGVFLSLFLGIQHILRPSRFLHTLRDIPPASSQSPLQAVTVALAGTLGVGNITGVASAMVQGGIGAVFWMWIGALCSMAVKFGEVVLAVRFRQRGKNGQFFGGTMYVIRDGFRKYCSNNTAYWLGAFFAILCLVNSFVTGNIVQSNAAADVLYPLPEWFSGGILACLTLLAVLYGIERTGRITLRLIPALTGIFILLSLWIVLQNLSMIPSILKCILHDAFSLEALGGGAVGMSIRELCIRLPQTGLGRSMRYGITRGIFSNEAGCGTSPTAHASADTKSPFHQGCYGIFEVICDTLVLCSLTAFVVCIGDRYSGILTSGDVSPALLAFRIFGGDAVYALMACMIALFAYATILAQMYYGFVAIGYFSSHRLPVRIYTVLSVLCVWVGAVLKPDIMWNMADSVIFIMTCINTAILFWMRKDIRDTVSADGVFSFNDKV